VEKSDFAQRVAIVTGAGGGLGRSYALELARRGARIVVNDIRGAEVVVAEIIASGGEAVASTRSVATRADGAAIVATALEAFGRLDILISNAGNLRHARFEEMSEEDIDDVIGVHLKGAFHVGQPAFAAMKRQGYGRIIFTASASGIFGHPWQASYAAAKAGIFGLANVVALEGRDCGVLCNVILPSARTPMADSVDFAWTAEVKQPAAALERLIALPGGGGERLDPEWVAPLVAYLASEQCATTHGVFSACSGRYARVITGVGPGWVAVEPPNMEDIATHWQVICDPVALTEPHSVYDEALAAREAITAAAERAV
jgi:NAD(P)-dependent dehydrogenase (short-subunit alcohol dehydrogenase family)